VKITTCHTAVREAYSKENPSYVTLVNEDIQIFSHFRNKLRVKLMYVLNEIGLYFDGHVAAALLNG
jgi:hypothetical protein